jgi:hypothetical protein
MEEISRYVRPHTVNVTLQITNKEGVTLKVNQPKTQTETGRIQQTTHVLVSLKLARCHTKGSLQFFDLTVSQAGLKQKMAHRPTTFNASSVTGNFFPVDTVFFSFFPFIRVETSIEVVKNVTHTRTPTFSKIKC